MNVTGDKRLIEDCGELEDAIATIQAAGLDLEHFDIDVHQMPPVADPRTGLFPIRYAVKVTNGMSGRGATLAGGNSEAWVERLEQKLEAGELSWAGSTALRIIETRLGPHVRGKMARACTPSGSDSTCHPIGGLRPRL